MFGRLIRGLIALLIVAGAAVVGLWMYTKAPPGWYAPPGIDDLRSHEIADLVENRVLEEVHKIRPAPGTWALRVRDEHVNAWLASKLADWIDYEQDLNWPDAIGMPQIRFINDGIDVAAQVATPDGARVIVARLAPFVSEGELRLSLERVMVGRLPIPGSAIEGLRRYVAAQTLEQYEGWLTGEHAVPLLIELSDDRTVRVLDARCDPGVLEVTLETK
jgi:hypothetical protein